jgi:hypothetical protein
MNEWMTLRKLITPTMSLHRILRTLYDDAELNAYINLNAGDNKRLNKTALYCLPKEIIREIGKIALIQGETFECNLEVLHPFDTEDLDGDNVFISIEKNEKQNSGSIPENYEQLKTKIPDGFLLSDVFSPVTLSQVSQSGIPDVSLSAVAVAVNHGLRGCVDNFCLTTRKQVNSGNILVRNNILNKLAINSLPAHLDPTHPNYTERAMVLDAIAQAYINNQHEELSHTKLVVKILRELGFDYTEGDEVTSHFAYITSPDGHLKFPMKKIK